MEAFLINKTDKSKVEKSKVEKPKKTVKKKEIVESQEEKKEEIIPTFPKLYQLNNNQKIYEWSIRIEKSFGDFYDIITAHGEKDGNLVSHSTTIEKGKVKRSILEQAVLEATSKWKNKKEKDLYTESIEETTNNIGNNVVVRPMLANTFTFDAYKKTGRGFKIDVNGSYIQRKYDGIRCIAYLKNGEVIMESRKGVAFQNFEVLREELKKMFSKLPSTFYFDGELYTNKYDFEVLCGLVRLTEKKVKNEDKERINQIEYHIYDYVDTNDLNKIYKERYEYLEDFLSKNPSPLIKKVPTEKITKLEDIKQKHDQYIQEGYEGIMIRDKNGPYEVQKRSKYLQKYKEFMEEEFKIIGFSEGSGDEKGCVLWNCETKDGGLFTVRPKGTKESRMELYNNGNKYVNKFLTVIFQEYSAEGIPRFPVGKGVRDVY